jgi:hypothetical protein
MLNGELAASAAKTTGAVEQHFAARDDCWRHRLAGVGGTTQSRAAIVIF